MLGEKDVSILGRLRDMIGSSFINFKTYMSEKLEYIKDKIEPVKNRLLGSNKNLSLDKGTENIR